MEIKYLTENTKKAEEFFLNELSFIISPFKLKRMIENEIENINIVDVRKYEDYIEGHIPYAIHVPYESLDEHLVMFEKKKLNIVYCYSQYCALAHKTAYEVAKRGYMVMVVNGGYKTWEKMSFDTVKTAE